MFKNIDKILNNVKFKISAETPTIAIAAGVIGLGAAIVLSGRATLKAQKVVEDHKAELELIAEDVDVVEDHNAFQKHRLNVGLKTAGKLLKVYGPTIAIAGLSISSIVYGRNAFQARLTSLSAAYQVLNSTLERYRKQVEAEVGSEKEDEIYYGALSEGATRDRVEDEDKAVIRKGEVNRSVYARFFDEASPNWTSRKGENRIFITTAERYFNDILDRRGYVFLNDVYAHLGMEETPEGQYIGWYRRAQGEDYKRIDFGIFNLDNERTRAFVNDQEPSILLDFNVDGYILNRI